MKTALHASKLQAALLSATLETISQCDQDAVEELAEETKEFIKSFLNN